jgi:branched-chain amino acid transport system ATP-binding protein
MSGERTTTSRVFQVEGLVKRFGGLLATDHVSLDIEKGEIHALIGPNGAGKTTLVNQLSGLLAPDAGRVQLGDIDLTPLPPHERVRAGLSRCFQLTSIFRNVSVLDNLVLAAQSHAGSSFRFFSPRAVESGLRDRAVELAEMVGLEGLLDHVAGALPHATQRQLDVALALAARPKLLLLDEPMAGMGPDESERMVHLIASLKQQMSILLIEHDMDAVFKLADRITVLVYGKVLLTGNADTVRSHPQVQVVYLGSEEHESATMHATPKGN